MTDMAESRSKRRCVLRKTVVPDAVHYVGYVEEEETPEMIMKKFEELEKIMAKNSTDSGKADQQGEVQDDSGAELKEAKTQEELDHAQLQEIFKATSVFSVKAVLGNNQALMDKQTIREQEGCWSEGDICSGAFRQQQIVIHCLDLSADLLQGASEHFPAWANITGTVQCRHALSMCSLCSMRLFFLQQCLVLICSVLFCNMCLLVFSPQRTCH